MASLLVASHAAARDKRRRISSPLEKISLGAGPCRRGYERQRAAHTHEEPEGEGGGGRVGAEDEPQDASDGEGEGSPPASRPPEGVFQATPPSRGGSPRPRPWTPSILKHAPDTQTPMPPPRLGDFEKDVPRPSLGWGGGAPSPELTLNPRYSDAARPGVCQPKLGHTTRGPPRRVERIEGR